ncbi:hypothetical protein E2C11_16535 [Streptomyces lavendulae]|nr:hypothetical protein [Streptomyces lavendulae]TXJ78613.1 hypothetical protein E2C11_16535 [Streptomyces lavendulae]
MPPKIKLTGQRFGQLTVVSRAENVRKRTAWLCRCDCGTEAVRTTDMLRSGSVKTCGCGKGSKLGLTGRRFGRLLVIEQAGRSARKDVMWRCRCDCGEEVTTSASSLSLGRTQSCGCLRREAVAAAATRHGQSDNPLHKRWRNMLDRTGNPEHPAYPDYGGRGITVCERWRAFENFAADMGPTFSSDLSLDRIDNDGNYEPANCRWATLHEQARNRRDNRTITWRGRTMVIAEWSEFLGFNRYLISQRLRQGWSVERALTTGADPDALSQLTT